MKRASARSAGVRIRLVMTVFAVLFAAIGARLVQLGLTDSERPAYAFREVANARPQILDRNGVLLATDLPSASVYAEPRYVPDVDETVEKLVAIFPDLDARQLHQRLKSDAAFAWLKRQVTPLQKQALWNAGLPAIGLRSERRRIYPNGPLAAHVLGAVDLDNVGISGIEKWIDGQGLRDLNLAGMTGDFRQLQPVTLSIDVRVQHALADETLKAMARFKAKAGAGLVLDVDNGEVLALASFPDFDPNVPVDALRPERLNRISAGAFEMGSTFKALTTAMALDSGQFTLKSVIDARKPLQFGRQLIRDYRGKYRMLTIPEVFIYSSNISTAKIAMTLGGEAQRAYLTRFGLMSRLRTELPESAAPILPRSWGQVTTATVSFGHGIAVTPLQASTGIAALINGGRLITPTFIKGAPVAGRIVGSGLVSPGTADAMRYLLRYNAEAGSARNGAVAGYLVGGKTGTAEKVVNGRYADDLVMTSFMAVVPADKPRYLLLTILDEPKGLPETHGFRTSGWNAVPLGSAILRRVLPMLGLQPQFVRTGIAYREGAETDAAGEL
ncbi:peptidoglycan D,D-transpeptidase FtsI family protein [Aminobacter sp. UC22_36]|uniref:peptidoglycan D,D-transpeptidase FtsI family protein n=1 Tax=Aminobacter sp. UC22_36 TaxID=3374549 RepID=UPI0037572853